MVHNVSLNTSMRYTLLSLQKTAQLQEQTQTRLATGLKVNSGLDNPSSYYTAQSLTNRANDLSALLDSMSQGIQTIKAASEALSTSIKFMEEASAVIEKAKESDTPIIAKVTTEEELLKAVSSGRTGFIVIAADISLTAPISLSSGQSLVSDNYFAEYNGANRKLSFSFDDDASKHVLKVSSNSTISNLDIDFTSHSATTAPYAIYASNANNINISNINLKVDAATATDARGIAINESQNVRFGGNINIQNNSTRGYGIIIQETIASFVNGADIKISTSGTHGYAIMAYEAAVLNVDSGANLNLMSTGGSGSGRGIHVSKQSLLNIRDGANVNISSTGIGILIYNNSRSEIAGNLNIKSNSVGLYNFSHAPTEPAGGNTTVIKSTAQIFIETASGAIGNGHAGTTTPPAPSTLIIEAGAKIGIKSSSNVSYKEANSTYSDTNNSANTNNYILWNTNISALTATASWGQPDWAAFNNSFNNFLNQTFSGDAEIQPTRTNNQYNRLLQQMDMLANDATYKGINLLSGQDLTVVFNEDRSSGLDIKGVDIRIKNLGLQEANWKVFSDIDKTSQELNEALKQLRAYESGFANYYSILQTRQDFTENLINVLTEGADKLTLADMNEEAANMLALQTRQQLAINSLSLASQGTQSVLKLFS